MKLASLFRRPSSHRTVIVHARPEFTAAAGDGWLERILEERITDKLHEKQGRSIARWTLADGSLVLFLKRHYRLPWWSGLLAKLFPAKAWSPGLQEWEHLQWAAEQGIPVPKTLAAAEWRGPGFKLQSFLAVEELADMLPLHEAIPRAFRTLTSIQFAIWKRRLIAELVRISVELHRRVAFHKDLYLCHFYIAASDCEMVPATFKGRTVAIDFHRLGLHSALAGYFQAKDLAQFLYSTFDVPGVTARDRLRFWKRYREAVRVRRFVAPLVRFKLGLYLRHARRKRARREGG